jgi:hypothetical protein
MDTPLARATKAHDHQKNARKAMIESTITSKGQTTVPAEVREKIGAAPAPGLSGT